ncbi:hypothetical protein R69749_08415 [Paraburkholderia domus]|nr:hypothetical protein R69749_08415 [Paraburkholderia domus]
MRIDETCICRIVFREKTEQPIEEANVGARLQRQVQIGHLAGRGVARVDHDDLHIGSRFLDPDNPLEQDRMAPRGIRSDQHDEVCQFEVFVAHRHQVFAERTLVPCNRRRHAQARIGVDVRAADIALHQLVGNVVVLRQQLSRDIECDRIRAVLIDDPAKAAGDCVERIAPRDIAPLAAARFAQLRMQQASVEPDRFAERRALHAKASGVCRMAFVAGNVRWAVRAWGRAYATTDAAIRAGGSDRVTATVRRAGNDDGKTHV